MILNIQALRALAALMVVAHHLGGPLAPLGLSQHDLIAGSSGVDIFFVISGFVMVSSVAARPLTPGGFYLNRLIRVAPLYWLVTIALGAAAIALPHLFRTVNATPLGLLKSIAFVPYLNDALGVTPVLHVGWTLNYEMFFYAVFALALAFGERNAMRTAIIALAMLVFLVALGAVFQPGNIAAKFYSDPILVEFGFGMALAVWHRRVTSAGSHIAGGMLLLGLIGLLVSPYAYPQVPRLFAWGVPAALVVAGALALERRGIAARSNFIQLLGAASYALYLIHPILLAAGARATAALNNPAAIILVLAVLVVVVVTMAIAVHKLIELPITRFLRHTVHHRQPVVPVMRAAVDPAASAVVIPHRDQV